MKSYRFSVVVAFVSVALVLQSVSGVNIRSTAPSSKAIGKVLEEIKNVGLVLESGQAKEKSAIRRVSKKCEDSIFRTKHALEMIENDCGGLSATVKGLQDQIASLKAVSAPLTSTLNEKGQKQANAVAASFLQVKAVPFVNELPSVDKSFNDDVLTGEKLLKVKEAEAGVVPVQSAKSLKSEKGGTVSDIEARLHSLQKALAEAISRKEARELVRQNTVHALTTITATCKMYNDGSKKRNHIRKSQVNMLSKATDTLTKKLKMQLTEEKANEQQAIGEIKFPEGTEEKARSIISSNFKNVLNSTLGRAIRDAFQEVNAEVYSEVADAREKAEELRKVVVRLQSNVNSLEKDVENDEFKIEKELDDAKKKMIESIRQAEILKEEQRLLEKDESQIHALQSENGHVLQRINKDSKRLKLLIAASKLRGKIAGIFSMAYADNIKELKKTYKVADDHKEMAQKAKIELERQRKAYSIAKAKAENNSISEFGAFLTGNERMRKKAEVARKAMEAAEKKYEELSKTYVHESTIANSSFLRAINLVKTEHELNATIVGLFERVKQLESAAFVTFTDRSVDRLFKTDPRVIATALRNTTNQLNLEIFDDVEKIKKNKEIIGSDKYDIRKITALKQGNEKKLARKEQEVRRLKREVEGIRRLITSEIQQRATKEKEATQVSIRLNTEENKASALQAALDRELQMELLGSKVNKMSEDDVSVILDKVEKQVRHAPMSSIRSSTDRAKEAIDKQLTLGQMLVNGDQNAPLSLGVLSGLSLQITGDVEEAKKKLRDSEAETASKLRILQESLNALYASQKLLKKTGGQNKTVCRELEMAREMKLRLETILAKEQVDYEKIVMQIRVSSAMIAKIEDTAERAKKILEEAKDADSDENEFTGVLPKQINTTKALEMQATASIEHQIATEKLTVEKEKLKTLSLELEQLREKAAAQGKIVEIKSPQCENVISSSTGPKFLKAQTTLRKAKAAYTDFAVASARTSALKSTLFVFQKKQRILEMEEQANTAIATKKTDASASLERLSHVADHDIDIPEMKVNETRGMIPVSDSSKSEVNQENKDVLEQTANQKSSLVNMMKNASAVATAQAEREAFEEKKQLAKEKKADEKIQKLHKETESLILNREDGLVGAMHDKPAAMLTVRKLAFEAKKRMSTATKRLKNAEIALKNSLRSIKTEASIITQKRLQDLKIKMQEAIPLNASYYFRNGEVLFDLHIQVPSDSSITLKSLIQGISDVVAHNAGVHQAAVTAVLHSREHVSVRIDVHTLAKAQGIAADMKEFLNDPTGSGFEAYLKRRISASKDFHAFLKSEIRARWTPSELIKTVGPMKLKADSGGKYNIDDFMNTYFETEPTRNDIHIKKIVKRNVSFSPFGPALPKLPDASHLNFDRRSPGAYGGVVDRLEFVYYQSAILGLTNGYVARLAAKAQAVLEVKEAEIFAARSARSAILLGAGLTNTTYVYDALPIVTQRRLKGLDESITEKKSKLDKFIEDAERKTENSRKSRMSLQSLVSEEQQLIQSKKSFEVYEQEFDSKARSEEDEKKRADIAKKAIEERRQKLQIEREQIEIVNEKKLAEKGELGKRTAISGGTGNAMTGNARATGSGSAREKKSVRAPGDAGPVTAEEVKEEEEKKIAFLTEQLSNAMETVKEAVDSARVARKKVMANDRRQSQQIKNLTIELRENIESNAIFKLSVKKKLAKLKRVQGDLMIKVSEARAKSKLAQIRKVAQVNSQAPQKQPAVASLTGSTGVATGPTGVATGPTGKATTGKTTAPTGEATGPTGKATGPTGKATGPTGKVISTASRAPAPAPVPGGKTSKEQNPPKTLSEVIKEAQMNILKPKVRNKCPNGLCECDGLGFKLCECCMSNDISALRKVAEQEMTGTKTDHVMSAFEKLRALKMKIIHLTHSCELSTNKFISLNKKIKSTTESIITSQEMLKRALSLHDAAQIDEHAFNIKTSKQELTNAMKQIPDAREQKDRNCQEKGLLKAELDKKVAQARKLKEEEVKAKNHADALLRTSLVKQLEVTTAKFLSIQRRVEEKVNEVFRIKDAGESLATGPSDETASATGNGALGKTGHAPTGLIGGTFSESGGAFYATGPRAVNEISGATGSATGSVYDYALELRAVNNTDRSTVALKPEIFDDQIQKALEVVQREISLVEKVEPQSETEKIKLESVKNWLLRAEYKLRELNSKVQTLVTDVKQARFLRREIDRLRDMKPAGVIDNAGGKLTGYDTSLSIFGEATMGGYDTSSFGSAEKMFLRVGIAGKLGIASSRVKVNDPVKVDGGRDLLRVSFEIGFSNDTMAINARQQVVNRLSEMTEVVFKGLRSNVVYVRHIISSADKIPLKPELDEADASERQLAELAGVPAENVTYHAPNTARVLSEALENEKNSIENSIQKGTFGSLIKAEKDALLKLNTRMQQQCANIARKYHAKYDFEGQKLKVNILRRSYGLDDVTEHQFTEGPTGIGGATGLYGGLNVPTGLEQTAMLQVTSGTGASGASGASGATGVAHLNIKQATDKALQQNLIMSNADDETLQNIKAIHVFQEEVEKIMQQKQDRLYRETVEAVANDNDGKLEKTFPLQKLFLRVAKASKRAALALIKKNRLLAERIRGTASNVEVLAAKNASKIADAEASKALAELKAGKISQLTQARLAVNEHLRSCTEKSKTWYEVATKNRKEQKAKALERKRIAEEKTKKLTEAVMKAKAEQTRKADALKKAEEKKKKKMAEQAAKKRETLREKLNRMIGLAIANGNKQEELNLRAQLATLDQIDGAQEHVARATLQKRNTILSKNHTKIIAADKRLRVAISKLNNLLMRQSVTGATGSSTGSTGGATGPNDGIIGGCVGISLHAAVANAQRRFQEEGTTMARLVLKTAKNMLNGRRKLCRVKLKLDAARASLRLAESSEERKSMMEDVTRYEQQIHLLEAIAKARISVRDSRLHEVELVDASDLVRANGERRTKEAVDWLNYLLKYGLRAFATGPTGATASTGAQGMITTGPTGVETGPTGMENYQALYIKVQKILLEVLEENSAYVASTATKKIVHILLENNAATKEETLYIGKELIRALEKAQEGISGAFKYERKIEHLLKSSWNTEGYLRLLASFDWKNTKKNESAVEHGEKALLAAVENVKNVKSSIVQVKKYLAELKQADLLLTKFQTSNEVLREAVVSPIAKLNQMLVSARNHETELQKRSDKWVEMVANAQQYVTDAHAWEKKKNDVEKLAF